MSLKGYDVFFTEPDTVESMDCRVCGTRCEVRRNLTGPTGWVEAMAKRGHWHDEFRCPHSGKKWHDKAVDLFREMEETASKSLAEILKTDLDDLLRENGIEPPGSHE